MLFGLNVIVLFDWVFGNWFIWSNKMLFIVKFAIWNGVYVSINLIKSKHIVCIGLK